MFPLINPLLTLRVRFFVVAPAVVGLGGWIVIPRGFVGCKISPYVRRINSDGIFEQVLVGDLLNEVIEHVFTHQRKIDEKPIDRFTGRRLVESTLKPEQLVLELVSDMMWTIDLPADTVEDAPEEVRCPMLQFSPQELWGGGGEHGGLVQNGEIEMFEQRQWAVST